MPYPTNATSMIATTFIWRHRYLGQATCEVLHEPSVAVPQVTLQAFADSMNSGMANVWKEIADGETALIGTECRYLAWEATPNTERLAFNFTETTGDRGDIVEDAAAHLDALPPYVSMLIRKYTDKAGRPNRGRMFLPFLSEMIQHDGLVDDGNIADCKAVADWLHTPHLLVDGAAEEIGTANPRLWNLKDNLFVPITRMMACVRLVTRRDRSMKVGQRPMT